MTSPHGSNPSGSPEPYVWRARVVSRDESASTAYSRTHAFAVGQPASFKESDEHPSAVELLLGALGGDLLSGLQRAAARRRVPVDALEASITGVLNNPLTVLGVIGESGHPGLETITCTVYLSADADDATLEQLWQTALGGSPLVHTLKQCVTLSLQMQIVI